MRESAFIEQNKGKWLEFEEALKGKTTDPEKLGELFIGITDDLSYARTFYPNRSVRVYLNNLSQRVLHNLYKKRSRARGRFRRFWTEELPAVMYSVRYELLISFLVFALSAVIGWLTEASSGLPVPQSYREDFMEYYSEQTELDFFFYVVTNNVRLACMIFVVGVFLGIGTLLSLMYNGLMLGGAMRWLHDLDYLGEASMSLWLHGTIELSAFVIAGAAGLVMGRGLALPGTYPRMTAFLYSARKGITIMLAVIALLLTSGFIEGFLTRHREVPEAVRLAIIITSAAFIVWFFVVYPFMRWRIGLRERAPEPVKSSPVSLNYNTIHSTGEVIKLAFVFIGRSAKVILPVMLLLSAALGAVLLLTSYDQIVWDFKWRVNPWTAGFVKTLASTWWTLHNTGTLFQSDVAPIMLTGTALCLGLIMQVSVMLIRQSRRVRVSELLPSLLFGSVVSLTLLIPWPLGLLAALFVLAPAGVLALSFMHRSESNGRWGFVVLSGQWGRVMALSVISVLMSLIIFVLISTPLIEIVKGMLEWFFNESASQGFFSVSRLFVAIVTVLSVVALIVCYALMVISCCIEYFSLREIHFARDLNARIQAFGSSPSLA